jgi:hypothetical protein
MPGTPEVENVERTQFVVLTGHLDERPLPELIRTLRVQRKTGRLQVEYPEGPGSFFFEEGRMVDARLGELRGVEAVYAALSLGGASFNFNPLVRPPERSIDGQGQQFIRDLVEAPRRDGLTDIRAVADEPDAPKAAVPLQPAALPQLPPAGGWAAPLEERLTAVEEAIIFTSHRFSRERLIYAVVIGFLVGLSIVTTINVFLGPSRNTPSPGAAAGRAPAATENAAAASREQTAGGGRSEAGQAATARRAQPTNSDEGAPAANSDEKSEAQGEQTQPAVPATAALIGTRKEEGVKATRREYVVQVLVEVKDGRVTDARVWNPRPGAAAYEAVALRMARERRYPEGFTGGERLKISVKQ